MSSRIFFLAAIATELRKLHNLFYSNFQIGICPGLFSSQQLQIPDQIFLTMPVLLQCFKLDF